MVEENVLQTEVATKQHGIRDATMIHKTGDAIRTTKNSDTITITKNSNRIMIKRKRGVVNGGEDYVRDDGDCGHRNKRNETTTTTTTTTLTDAAEHGDLLDAFEKVIFDVAAEMEQRRVFVLMVTV